MAFSALWRLRSGPQSQPIDPEMFGTKAPRTSRDGQHSTFQTVPAAAAPFFLPSWIPSELCSVCHTRHADAGFCPLSGASPLTELPNAGPRCFIRRSLRACFKSTEKPGNLTEVFRHREQCFLDF
jgi:hypothetical protein